MKSVPFQNGKHRNYLQNTSFSAFPCQLNKPLISAKVAEWYAPPGRVLQEVRSRRAVPSRPVAAPPLAPSHDRAHLPCPVAPHRRPAPPPRPLPCAPLVSRCGRARCPHRAAAPRRGARLCPLAPLAAPRCAILTLHPHISRATLPMGAPHPGRRDSRPSGLPTRALPPLHPRQSHAMLAPPSPRPSPCLVARSSITPAHFPRYIACGGSPSPVAVRHPPPAEVLGPKNKKTAR